MLFGASSGVVIAGPLEDGLAAAQHGDFAAAVQLWRPLAEVGNAEAQYRLGVMYANGKGVAKDVQEAAKWYRLAAAQGHTEALYLIGASYFEGNGVAQDYKEAAKWYRLAATQGDALAQVLLGQMYEGKGVAQDFVREHMWFNLAAAQGDADGAKLRDAIAKRMTAQQIAEAQAMARKCEASNYKECNE